MLQTFHLDPKLKVLYEKVGLWGEWWLSLHIIFHRGLDVCKQLIDLGFMDTKGYEWINTIKRENTTDFVFPNLHAGDAVFYNYTVKHGVAPLVSGVRYSMAFFFDMDNPDALDKLEGGDFVGNSEKFAVELHNGLKEKLDILLLYNHDNEYDEYDMLEVKERLFSYVPPNNTEVYERALVGDIGLWP